jgi:hypothetical protein
MTSECKDEKNNEVKTLQNEINELENNLLKLEEQLMKNREAVKEKRRQLDILQLVDHVKKEYLDKLDKFNKFDIKTKIVFAFDDELMIECIEKLLTNSEYKNLVLSEGNFSYLYNIERRRNSGYWGLSDVECDCDYVCPENKVAFKNIALNKLIPDLEIVETFKPTEPDNDGYVDIDKETWEIGSSSRQTKSNHSHDQGNH